MSASLALFMLTRACLYPILDFVRDGSLRLCMGLMLTSSEVSLMSAGRMPLRYEGVSNGSNATCPGLTRGRRKSGRPMATEISRRRVIKCAPRKWSTVDVWSSVWTVGVVNAAVVDADAAL